MNFLYVFTKGLGGRYSTGFSYKRGSELLVPNQQYHEGAQIMCRLQVREIGLLYCIIPY